MADKARAQFSTMAGLRVKDGECAGPLNVLLCRKIGVADGSQIKIVRRHKPEGSNLPDYSVRLELDDHPAVEVAVLFKPRQGDSLGSGDLGGILSMLMGAPAGARLIWAKADLERDVDLPQNATHKLTLVCDPPTANGVAPAGGDNADFGGDDPFDEGK